MVFLFFSQRSPVKHVSGAMTPLSLGFLLVKFDFLGSSLLLSAQFFFCAPGGNKHGISCVSEDLESSKNSV